MSGEITGLWRWWVRACVRARGLCRLPCCHLQCCCCCCCRLVLLSRGFTSSSRYNNVTTTCNKRGHGMTPSACRWPITLCPPFVLLLFLIIGHICNLSYYTAISSVVLFYRQQIHFRLRFSCNSSITAKLSVSD